MRPKFRTYHTPQESHEDRARPGLASAGEDAIYALMRRRTESEMHLPPTITIRIVPLDDLDALAGTKRDLVSTLWDKVLSGIDVFYHGNVRKRSAARDDGMSVLGFSWKER